MLELDLLREHIRRVTETGPGYAVLLLGESGIGKSRLAGEARAEALKVGMNAISVQCLGRSAEPLLPFKEGLAAYLGRSPDRIRRTLTGAAPHLLDAVPFIGAFLGQLGESLAEGVFSGSDGTHQGRLRRRLRRSSTLDGTHPRVPELAAIGSREGAGASVPLVG